MSAGKGKLIFSQKSVLFKVSSNSVAKSPLNAQCQNIKSLNQAESLALLNVSTAVGCIYILHFMIVSVLVFNCSSQ